MKNTENDIAQQDKPGGKYAQKPKHLRAILSFKLRMFSDAF